MQKKNYVSLLVTTLIATGLIIAFPDFAQTNQGQGRGEEFRGGVMMPGVRAGMGVRGTVASISGTTLTVNGKARASGEGSTTTVA